jgi:hypothetical protein
MDDGGRTGELVEKVSEMAPQLQYRFLPFYPIVPIFDRKTGLPPAFTINLPITR